MLAFVFLINPESKMDPRFSTRVTKAWGHIKVQLASPILFSSFPRMRGIHKENQTGMDSRFSTRVMKARGKLKDYLADPFFLLAIP